MKPTLPTLLVLVAAATSSVAATYEFRTPKKGLSVVPAVAAPAPAPAPAPTPAPAPAPTRLLTLSTTALDFSDTQIGSSKTAQVSLSNTGTGTVTLNNIGVTGSPSFSVITSCGASLAPGALCFSEVTFAPTATETLTGTLSFDTNATNTPHTVGLSGTGRLPSGLVSVAGLTFSKPDGVSRNRADAVAHCSGLTALGGGWRVPSSADIQPVISSASNRQQLVDAGWPNYAYAWMWNSDNFNGANGYVWRVDTVTAQQGLQGNHIYLSYDRFTALYPVSCVK